jgi:hypothetical protein
VTAVEPPQAPGDGEPPGTVSTLAAAARVHDDYGAGALIVCARNGADSAGPAGGGQ